MKALNLLGQTFGQLTVLERVENKNGETRWKCKCSCSNISTVTGSRLKKGKAASCGCMIGVVTSRRNKIEKVVHGLRKTNLYSLWNCIKGRTQNSKSRDYYYYGGRGIGMYQGWVNDPEAFINYIEATIGPRIGKLELDREDNEKGYEPGNLRWATSSRQSRNTRKTRKVFWNGEPTALLDVVEQTNCQIKYQTVLRRIDAGWTLDRALTEIPKPRGKI